MIRVQGNGPIPTRVMLVGEAPGEEEERRGEPFVGASGMELNRMLHEAGILRSECYVTNVCKTRPPDNRVEHWIAKAKKDITPAHREFRGKYVLPQIIEGYEELLAEIKMVEPNLIIAFGNLPLLALTGQWGVLRWRGSQLTAAGGIKVIPTIHPAAVLREWSNRALVVTDLRRARRHMGTKEWENVPQWNFAVTPSVTAVCEQLNVLLTRAAVEDLWIDFDIETRYGHIDCIGLSWSRHDALCIPFICRRGHYWGAEEEARIIYLLYRLLTHPRVSVRWQNGLYDAQYVYKHWHFIPNGRQDTMISQHSLFAALPKGLHVLGSMYCDYYRYWKDEGKIASDGPEEQRWVYNLQDCVYTREAGEVLTQSLAAQGLAEVDRRQQALFYPVLRAMTRGVRVSPERRAQMAVEVEEALSDREAFLFRILGHSINVRSPKQMCALFYEDLKQPPVLKRTVILGRTRMAPTVDDEALSKIAAREPLLRPVCNAIADIRTLGKFLNDFVLMPLDEDGRMRCSFNIAGDAGGKSAPYSYRLSSSKNAFGSGGNLQTIPSEKSKSAGKAAARASMEFHLPNIRSMYVPDPGYTFFDMDLDRADLQVVVWESGEKDWMAAMQLGVDMHLLNVYTLDNQEPPPMEELIETHPKYPDHRGPRRHKREFAKVFCHATNYVGGAKTVAAHTGRLVSEIERAQRQWFGAHPGVEKWHRRVEAQINRHRFVENRFGYRWYIFDRLDGLLPEAVAWIPQSTVGCVINQIWTAFDREIPDLQVLLQVHDSLAGQFPTHRSAVILPLMQQHSRVVVPYDTPLIIPAGVKTSAVSWGECK
jgi:uracil-DNA glycosylase/DNA polymerase I-like protein with 3'-5' exonuclease and polymerase domains